MKQLSLSAIVITLVFFCSCAGYQYGKARKFQFREVWGYLMKGEEREITGREPFTDILYFGVSINESGRLVGAKVPPSFFIAGRRPRVHLVVFKLANPSLLHNCLNHDQKVRDRLVDEIARAAVRYDGVQIDFEELWPVDSIAYLDFLCLLKKRLPTKTLSIAVPARRKKSEMDAYDYGALSRIVDKIFIMAYDQHWRTSAPGPVASLSWCGSIANYATDRIPPEKLVMGMPLYGRAWQDKILSRALTYKQIADLKKQTTGNGKTSMDKGPYFEYSEKVTVRVFYEDVNSLKAKMRMYKSYGVTAVAFWRIGQGPRELWDTISPDYRNVSASQ